MGNEDSQCRRPLVASWNSYPRVACHTTTNIIGFLRGVSTETGGLPQESGKPDTLLSWSRRLYGGEGKAWVEFKAGDSDSPWRVSFDAWRENQVGWYARFAVPTETPYFVGVFLYPEKRLSYFRKEVAHVYLVPAHIWLSTAQELATLDILSIACTPEMEREKAKKPYNAAALWSDYKVHYDTTEKRYALPTRLFEEMNKEWNLALA